MIKPGDIYQIKDDFFLCGDIHEDEDFQVFQKYIPKNVYLVYSDPPWNKGNHKYWRTHAGISTPAELTFEKFTDRVFLITSGFCPEHYFFEHTCHGKQNYEWFIEKSKGKIKNFDKHWTCYYGAPVSISDTHETRCRRPNKLLHFGKEINNLNPEGLRGSDMTRHVFSFAAKQGEYVFDCCVGKGMTSRIAYEFGMKCIGIEINPKRLEITVKWLEKKTKTTAKLLRRK